VDSAGVVWVSDRSNRRIQSFSADGELVSILSEGADGLSLGAPGQPAVDAAGRLFVTIGDMGQMQVFAGDGVFLGALETGDPSAEEVAFFGFPGGLALDGQGHVYIADFDRERVARYRLMPPLAPSAPLSAEQTAIPAAGAPAAAASPAELVWQTEGGPDLPLDGPYKPALDPAGNLWVPDGRNHRFQIFSPDGAFLESWGTEGSGDGQFNFELGSSGYGTVLWDKDGNFYVADPGNYRIQKFAPDRSFIAAWGGSGMDEGQFMGLNDLALDLEGRLYATDHGRDDIQVFDRDGRFLDSWGGYGSEPGQFLNPAGIAVDEDGNLYVSEFQGHRIQKLAPDGTPLAMWGNSGTDEGEFLNPEDVILDGQGRVFVTEWSSHRVQVFDADGRFLASWGGMAGLGERQFGNPNGATLDGDGFIYVSDDGRDRVQKFRLLPPIAPD
jgi:sugar lactone lactonase YvrE